MSDVIASGRAGVVENMERLADRLASVVPPPVAATLASVGTSSIPRPSAAVQAALASSAAKLAQRSRQPRQPRSMVGAVIDSFVRACAFIPYALVALLLRFAIARVFFLAGQSMVDGPRVPLNIQDFEFSVILPLQVKAQTFTLFIAKFSEVPVPPLLGAYLVSYAEFFLPIFLLLGFATRFSALGLLIIVAMIQLFVLPEALWSLHIYWVAILLVLLSLGPGPISVDHVIRYLSRR